LFIVAGSGGCVSDPRRVAKLVDGRLLSLCAYHQMKYHVYGRCEVVTAATVELTSLWDLATFKRNMLLPSSG
jgi:hypothetical protein